MRNLLRYLLLVLLLIVVALVSALTTMRLAIHVQEVRVPDLRGKTPAEAERVAEAKGVAMQVASSYYSPTVPEGRVLSQGPAPGALVRRGWQVQVALSLGPQRVTIPQVVGESDRAAAITIEERGLQLSSTDNLQLSTASAGEVIAQSPPAGATDALAPRISLLVAQQPAPQAFVMPNFVGQPLGTATNILKDAGFSLGKVTLAATPVPATPAATTAPAPQTPPQQASPPPQITPASLIVTQDPPAGHKVFAGAAINFTVR